MHHYLCLQMHSWVVIVGGNTNFDGAPDIGGISGLNCCTYHGSIV